MYTTISFLVFLFSWWDGSTPVLFEIKSEIHSNKSSSSSNNQKWGDSNQILATNIDDAYLDDMAWLGVL